MCNTLNFSISANDRVKFTLCGSTSDVFSVFIDYGSASVGAFGNIDAFHLALATGLPRRLFAGTFMEVVVEKVVVIIVFGEIGAILRQWERGVNSLKDFFFG